MPWNDIDSMETTFKLLDKIDILSLLEQKGRKGIEVYDLMMEIEDLISEDEVDKYPELEGSLYLMVNDSDFLEYLYRRYPGKINHNQIVIDYVSVK